MRAFACKFAACELIRLIQDFDPVLRKIDPHDEPELSRFLSSKSLEAPRYIPQAFGAAIETIRLLAYKRAALDEWDKLTLFVYAATSTRASQRVHLKCVSCGLLRVSLIRFAVSVVKKI